MKVITMRTLIRIGALTLAAALISLLAIACGGGNNATTSSQPTGDTDGSKPVDLVSAAPEEVLSASAEAFQQEVSSLQMEMKFTLNAGDLVVDSTSEMAFQAPDKMHVTMDITGLGSFEALVLGKEVYANIPGTGWVAFSLDDVGVDNLGVDVKSFEDVFSHHSFVDIAGIVESLGGDVEDVGEETVDGGTYEHYRGTLDFADLTNAFSDAFNATGGLALLQLSGPLTFDTWVDPDTFLPYVLTATGELTAGAGGTAADAMSFDASMRFTGYNGAVEIPSAPENAVPFAMLGGP
jgi:hypothetical protein